LKNAQEAIHHGAGDFISKPFNIPDIISIVNKSFMRRRYNLQINSLVQKIKGLKDLEEEKQEGLQEDFPLPSGENINPSRGASEH